eukprot:1343610-Pyramimonas_sp.AAC.2
MRVPRNRPVPAPCGPCGPQVHLRSNVPHLGVAPASSVIVAVLLFYFLCSSHFFISVLHQDQGMPPRAGVSTTPSLPSHYSRTPLHSSFSIPPSLPPSASADSGSMCAPAASGPPSGKGLKLTSRPLIGRAVNGRDDG